MCAHCLAGRPRSGGGLVTAVLRPVAAPFVAAPPGGARVRARLRVPPGDEAVLRAVGAHLGSLAGRDLAARCGEGRLDAKGKAVSRAGRKRALTAASSSRWARAITRTSEDQVRLAEQNLRAGPSGGWSPASPPAGSATASPRWRATRAWRSSSSTRPIHLPVGSRALATAPAGAPPQDDRAPRGSGGDRATRTRPPGQAPRDREPARPGGRGTASPGADQDQTRRRDRTQETRHPTRPPAATRR